MLKALIASTILLAGSIGMAQLRGPRPGYENYGNPQVKTFMPPNGAHQMDRVERTSQITEEQFNEIVDNVVKHWEPIAAAKGVKLVAHKLWNDSTVNAVAYQSGKTWNIEMYGGLARRPEVTPDGFALVVCHELGHHFGGYVFYGDNNWASTEGQSDYWATNVCAKVVWGNEFRQNESFRRIRNVPPSVQQACGNAFPSNTNQQGWCVRAAAGGHSLASLLAALGREKQPQFETPDTTVVTRTNTQHPRAQCRLDTYFAGSLCNKPFDLNVIPGKGHAKGQNSKDAEAESMKYTCFAVEGMKEAARPTCWFKGQLDQPAFRRF
ncbi:MAG: hypothetical protein KF789_00270 [Bdellovibrionaceae bacterium]|nr:hypothetical protein [Pseudobdellovibrionaceae bacterium]